MPNMTTYKFGDIILVPLPFTDQTISKKRPAVVVSSDEYNAGRADLIIMAITSRLHQVNKLGEKMVDDTGRLPDSSSRPYSSPFLPPSGIQ